MATSINELTKTMEDMSVDDQTPPGAVSIRQEEEKSTSSIKKEKRPWRKYETKKDGPESKYMYVSNEGEVVRERSGRGASRKSGEKSSERDHDRYKEKESGDRRRTNDSSTSHGGKVSRVQGRQSYYNRDCHRDGDRGHYKDDDRGHYKDDDRGHYKDYDRGHYKDDDRGHYKKNDRGHYKDDDRDRYKDYDRGYYKDDDRGYYKDDDRGYYKDDDRGHYKNDDRGHYKDYGRGRYKKDDRGRYKDDDKGHYKESKTLQDHSYKESHYPKPHYHHSYNKGAHDDRRQRRPKKDPLHDYVPKHIRPVPPDLSADTKLLTYQEIQGDLFSSPPTSSLAHCVSEDLFMGKGIATIFKERFKRVEELKSQGAGPGGVALLEDNGRYIYYLVTKKRYFHKPTIHTLYDSLCEMKEHIQTHNVSELSMPLIGCGLDQLEWSEVSLIINELFHDVNISITIYYL